MARRAARPSDPTRAFGLSLGSYGTSLFIDDRHGTWTGGHRSGSKSLRAASAGGFPARAESCIAPVRLFRLGPQTSFGKGKSEERADSTTARLRSKSFRIHCIVSQRVRLSPRLLVARTNWRYKASAFVRFTNCRRGSAVELAGDRAASGIGDVRSRAGGRACWRSETGAERRAMLEQLRSEACLCVCDVSRCVRAQLGGGEQVKAPRPCPTVIDRRRPLPSFALLHSTDRPATIML